MTQVAIILLAVNQSQITLRCLASLNAASTSAFKVLLWDNGSSDGTAEAVRLAFPEVYVHEHPYNAGVASGRNLAVQLAVEAFQPSHVLFLDNDMTVAPDFLEHLLSPCEGQPRLAQTTGKILDMDSPQRIYGAGGCRVEFWRGNTRHMHNGEIDQGQFDVAVPCIPSGGCMLVRVDVFQELGGFDTAFDPYGPEDLDFGLRARRAGYYGLYVPQAVVYHPTRPGRTFGGGQYSESFAYHRARNWFLFMRRHASPTERMGFYLVGAPSLLGGFLVRQARSGRLPEALRGLWRGALAARRG